MKHTRRIASLLLALVMVFAMAISASAESDPATPTNGTITITPPSGVDASATNTYKIYKVFDAVGNGSAINYTVMESKKNSTLPSCFSVDAGGNVSYIGQGTNNQLTSADITAIATYIQGDSPVATATSNGSANAIASNLSNGYYYITTTTGTAVAITSTNPNASVTDKNKVPELTKEVLEDANHNETADTNESWSNKNDANIGDKVLYNATIKLQPNSKTATMHDTMTAGLTFNNDVTISNLTKGVDYTVNYNDESAQSDGCTFEVVFTDEYLKSIVTETTITVNYSATLNENAVVANGSNDNTAKLTYGENNSYNTTPSKTTTYTWEFSVLKYTSSEKTPLAGAQFSLYADENCTTALKFTQSTGSELYKYDKNGSVTVITTTSSGTFEFEGLDSGDYWLKEIEAPAGYNKLTAPIKVSIDANGNVNTYDTNGNASDAIANKVVEVENNSGSTLPSTGGMGTTLFYVVGGLMVLAAVVLLVTKKRMSSAE